MTFPANLTQWGAAPQPGPPALGVERLLPLQPGVLGQPMAGTSWAQTLGHVGPQPASSDFFQPATPDEWPQAGRRSQRLVEEYMAAIECWLESPAGGGRSLTDIRRTMEGDQPRRPWRRIEQNLRYFCNDLSASVGEFIRWKPEMAAPARAVGRRLAEGAAQCLAEGKFVPPPTFYRIAEEATALARHEETIRRAQQEATEHAAWSLALDSFYANVARGPGASGSFIDTEQLLRDGTVVVFGGDALKNALRFLPAGTFRQSMLFVEPHKFMGMVERVDYPTPGHSYQVLRSGVKTTLQMRRDRGIAEYRLGTTGPWLPNPHAPSADRQQQQELRLRTLFTAVYVRPPDANR